MSQHKFQSLLMQYGRSVGMGQSVDLILEGRPIEVDGVVFSLDYQPADTPEHFTVYGDLGALPGIGTAEVQGALLRMNMAFYMAHGLCLTISPMKKDHAMFSLNIALADATATSFSATLESLAKISKDWQRQQSSHLQVFSTRNAVRPAPEKTERKSS